MNSKQPPSQPSNTVDASLTLLTRAFWVLVGITVIALALMVTTAHAA